MNQSKPATSGLLLVLFPVAIVALVAYWVIKSQKSHCCMQLRNYNTAIASCGIDGSSYDAWKDPAKTELLVFKLFGEKIPTCPSGGTCSIVLGKRPYITKLVCSMEHSRGHFSPD